MDYRSINKNAEQLCGDNVKLVRPSDDVSIAVLADGLGSGVKANILSILTSTILSTMMANRLSIDNCVKTISSILPICKVRQIAYSTFSAIKVSDNRLADIIEYDNPQVIILRDGKNLTIERSLNIIDGKKIYLSQLYLELNDIVILVSDGAIHAGIGLNYNFGWQRDDLIKFLEQHDLSEMSAKNIASMIVNKCNELYGNAPGDDTTACVVKIVEQQVVNLLIGPAKNKEDDNKMMNLFFAKGGTHIISGGTTANIAARYLSAPVECDLDLKTTNPGIPPISTIKGVDLVTEGVITINKVLANLKDYLDQNLCYEEWINGDDGASLVTRYLIQKATNINFYVGCAINPAHQNPDLQIDFTIKMKLIEEIIEELKKIGKKVTIAYF